MRTLQCDVEAAKQRIRRKARSMAALSSTRGCLTRGGISRKKRDSAQQGNQWALSSPRRRRLPPSRTACTRSRCTSSAAWAKPPKAACRARRASGSQRDQQWGRARLCRGSPTASNPNRVERQQPLTRLFRANDRRRERCGKRRARWAGG